MKAIRAFACGLLALTFFVERAQAETERRAYATPYGVDLSVTTGEVVFVAGSVEMADSVTLASDVAGMMPGSMAIPFHFEVRAGTYPQTREDAQWTWFCVPLDRAGASFPGLGEVVRSGDCVGLRKRKADRKLEWVVDNSVYNRGLDTVWSRSVRPAEAAQLRFGSMNRVADAFVDNAVTFDGFYGGLLNFTFVDAGRRREMKFDYDGKSQKMIGMLGRRMLVLGADSVGLKYRWMPPGDSK